MRVDGGLPNEQQNHCALFNGELMEEFEYMDMPYAIPSYFLSISFRLSLHFVGLAGGVIFDGIEVVLGRLPDGFALSCQPLLESNLTHGDVAFDLFIVSHAFV